MVGSHGLDQGGGRHDSRSSNGFQLGDLGSELAGTRVGGSP